MRLWFWWRSPVHHGPRRPRSGPHKLREVAVAVVDGGLALRRRSRAARPRPSVPQVSSPAAPRRTRRPRTRRVVRAGALRSPWALVATLLAVRALVHGMGVLGAWRRRRALSSLPTALHRGRRRRAASMGRVRPLVSDGGERLLAAPSPAAQSARSTEITLGANRRGSRRLGGPASSAAPTSACTSFRAASDEHSVLPKCTSRGTYTRVATRGRFDARVDVSFSRETRP